MLRATGRLHLSCCSSRLGCGGLRCEVNSGDDVRHRTAAIGAQHLDSDDVGGLGDTVLLRRNGTGAVSAMTVVIVVDVVQWDCLAPGCPTLKLSVLSVDSGVNDVYVDTFAA